MILRRREAGDNPGASRARSTDINLSCYRTDHRETVARRSAVADAAADHFRLFRQRQNRGQPRDIVGIVLRTDFLFIQPLLERRAKPVNAASLR